MASYVRYAAGWVGLDITPFMLDFLVRLLLPNLVRLAEAYAAGGDLDAIEFLASSQTLASRPEPTRLRWN